MKFIRVKFPCLEAKEDPPEDERLISQVCCISDKLIESRAHLN